MKFSQYSVLFDTFGAGTDYPSGAPEFTPVLVASCC